jgi:hypothetical protein
MNTLENKPVTVRELISGVGNGKTTACVMSLASVLANEPFSDRPSCVCPIIRKLCIRLNDADWWEGDAERTRKLWPLARRVLGSRSTPEVEAKRVRICVLTAARVFAPAALRARGLEEAASQLEAIPDDASYESIRDACRSTADAANAAANAANAAAAAYATAAAYAAAAAYDAAAAAAYAAVKLTMRRALKDLILRCLEVKS